LPGKVCNVGCVFRVARLSAEPLPPEANPALDGPG
jgi:hypothetical protein